jgi:2-polyprenyl-3-methyl-5-hydroxy-6-metoxy-1,4-benzoquinol methylase
MNSNCASAIPYLCPQPKTTMEDNYRSKSQTYFTNIRKDIEPLLPAQSERVLEIGCGNGATLAYYKERKRFIHTTGLELMPEVVNHAIDGVDAWLIGSVETQLQQIADNSLDLVLCLDVLEHLLDPWAVVDQIATKLKPGGLLIASIPNMRTAVVLSNLLFRGRFEYANQGIMDRTHLRWFTKKSAQELLSRPPLVLQACLPTPFAKGSKSALFNFFTFGFFREFVTEQFLIKSIKTP